MWIISKKHICTEVLNSRHEFIIFFWFFKIFGSDQLATFFVSSDLPWHMVENSCRLFNTSVHICFLLIIHIYALLKHILSMIMQIFAHTHYHTRDLLLIRSNLIWKMNLICSSFKRLKFVYIVLISKQCYLYSENINRETDVPIHIFLACHLGLDHLPSLSKKY